MVLQSFRKDEHSRKNRITLENTAFYQLMPENSDSVGRRFESCRAYQNAVKSYDFTAFLYKLVKFSPLRHSSVGWSLFMDK